MRISDIISKVRKMATDEPASIVSDGADLAAAYADLCRKANERLNLCEDYLKKGMASEALRAAESDPSLLDLCAELDFIGVEKWREICVREKWQAPDSIDARVVQILNNAYTSGLALEPLLQEYRRAVRNQNIRECVKLLRNIVKIDKNTSHWAEDLRGFENKRLDEIKSSLKKAVQSEDETTLAALMVELNAQWSIAVDAKLCQQVHAAIKTISEKKALENGKALLIKITAAYSALNYHLLAPAIEKYQVLQNTGYLHPDENMKLQYQEALEWFLDEQKKLHEQELYQETLARIRSAVERGDAKPLEELLNIAARYDEPLPDRLEERAQGLIEAHLLERERTRRRCMMLAGALVLILAVGIGLIVSRIRHQSYKKGFIKNIEAAHQARNSDQCKILLNRLESKYPKLLNNEDVQAWCHRIDELDTVIERQSVTVSKVIKRLETIRQAGFNEDAAIVEALIAEAQTNMIAGTAEGELFAILSEWRVHKQLVQQKLDQQALAEYDLLVAAVDELASLADPNSSDKYAEIRQKISTLQLTFKDTSPDVNARFVSLAAKVDSQIRGMDERRQQISLIASVETLRDYMLAINTYAKAFPDDSISKSVADLISVSDLCIYISEPSFSCSSNNPFWFAAYKQQEAISVRSQEKWPEVKAQLLSLDADKRYTELYTYQSPHGIIFIEGLPSKIYDQGIAKYQIVYYHPGPNDLELNFQTRKLEGYNNNQFVLMPHCDFINELISMARFANANHAVQEFFDQMQKLYKVKGISPLLRLRLMNMLAGFIVEMVGMDNLPGWGTFLQDVGSIDTGLHWLSVLHRDVIRANQESERILNRYCGEGSFLSQTAFLADIRILSLSRNIQWTGRVNLTNTSVVALNTTLKPRELWVVRKSHQQSRMYVALEYLPNGDIKKHVRFVAGEPVFSPSDGKSTFDLLTDLRKKHGIRNLNHLMWPTSWPENIRQ